MTSQSQIEANRRNAQLSTGPKTPEGKARVALNPLTHGLRAQRAVLPDENEEEFHQLCADLEAEWQPQDRTEQLLLEGMVMAQWKLARLEVVESQTLAKGHVNKEQMALLVQVFQQQARLERSFKNAMHELERRQKNRPIAQEPAEAHPAEAAETAHQTAAPPKITVLPTPDPPTPPEEVPAVSAAT